MSKTNARILGEIAGAGQYGIYAGELSKAIGLPRDEVVYRAKEMQGEELIEILSLTDLNFRLHEEVTNLLGAKTGQFMTAYSR